MKFWIVSLLIVPCLGFANQQIQVQSHVKVNNKQKLVLLDLVESSGVDETLAKKLESIELGNAPRLGEKREFTGRALSMALRNAIDKSKDLQIKIPRKVIVENPGLVLTDKLLRDELMKNWKLACSECQFEIIALNRPLVPDNKFIKSYKINSTKSLPKGSFSIPTSLSFTDGTSQNIWLSGQVKILRKVTVTKRNLQRGDRLHHSDIKTAYRDVTFSYDHSPERESLLGKKLNLGLQKDQIIWGQFVARERILSRGEIVKVTLGDDNYKITMMAQAEQDAYVGDTVRLKNLKTKKVFSGIVNDQGKVVLR